MLLVAYLAIAIIGAVPFFTSPVPGDACYSSLLAPFGGCQPYPPSPAPAGG